MANTVFIVDDDPDLTEFYSQVLMLSGYEVVATAENGLQAVELFRSLPRKPDVILMDHRMPLMSGLDACRQILRLDPEACIILASADHLIEEEARSLGVADFKRKPFSVDHLLRNIRGLLDPLAT